MGKDSFFSAMAPGDEYLYFTQISPDDLFIVTVDKLAHQCHFVDDPQLMLLNEYTTKTVKTI